MPKQELTLGEQGDLERLKSWRSLAAVVLSLFPTAVAALLSAAALSAGEIPSFVPLTVVGFAVALVLSTVILSRIARKRRRGGRLKMEIKDAYDSALKRSPLNPVRE